MSPLEQRPIGKILPTRFIWKIHNYSKLNQKQYFSDVFIVGGCEWKLSIIPTAGKIGSSLALFLLLADSSGQLEGCRVEAEFSLAVVDQISKQCIEKDLSFKFSTIWKSSGFLSFMHEIDLRNSRKGYLANDSCVVEVAVSVRKVVGYRIYDGDSKKESGLVDKAAPAKGGSMTTLEQPPIGKLLPARFIWKIDDFSKLNEEKYYSDVFVIGGCKWKLKIYPKGSKHHPFSLLLYLKIADSSTQPDGWSVEAEYSLAVIDQISKESIVDNSSARFTAQNKVWRYGSFMSLSDLRTSLIGYLVNDSCVVVVGVSVRKVVGYTMYLGDTKKESGPVDTVAPAKVTKEPDGYGTEREVKKLAYHSVLQNLYLQGDLKWKNEFVVD